MKKTSKEIIEKQSRKILELESQLASTYHLASVEIKNASEERLIGSGVLVQLTGIGGKNIVMPFLIRDGLNKNTIDALKAEMIKSYNLSIMFKP